MILNQWRCPYPDGHNPKVCPGGQPLVAFGSSTVRVVNWRTGAVLLETKGRAPHWLTDTDVVWLEELGGDRDRLWTFDTATGRKTPSPVDPALCAANVFSASDGVWASYLANPRRVVVNGEIMPGSFAYRGVSVSYGTILTCVNDQYLQVFDAYSLQPLQRVDPAGTFNKYFNYRGSTFHGYWGDTYCARPGMARSAPTTVTPWHAEGVAVATNGAGGRLWCATATEIAPSTKERRVGVLVRPVGEMFALAVWDIEMDTLDMAHAAGALVLAGASTTGVLTVLELDETFPLEMVAWPVPVDHTFGQAMAWAGYHEYTVRTDWPRRTTLPKGNATAVWERGALATTGDMPVIVPDFLLDEVTHPERVVGFYEGSESSDVASINVYCQKVRAIWAKKFPTVRVPPVISYLQPMQVQHMAGAFPNEVDIFSPQFYFETGETPPRIDYFATMAWWMKLLPADRLWMPTVQTYDRNFLWNAGQMSVLCSQQGQLISLAREYQHIIGYLCFAVNRPGGIEKWPTLREALDKVATLGGISVFPSRWPYRPPAKPTEPVDPPPVHPGDDMTHDDLHRWAAELPDTPLFGALGRFHNEVLPRDRPVDPVKTAEGGPFNTSDVTTGGANGYFIRMFMTEYFISRDKGRTPEQAIGDGYDAAKKSYDKAVGNPQ